VERFVARQPIFNHSRVVFGYELLFRSGPENYFSSPRPDHAAAATADNLLLIGIDRLTQGRRAFINCTREFLVHEFALLLPKDRVVVEILETVQPDDEVVAACTRLKRAGYLLALDDFREAVELEPLVALANFIKVDFLASSVEEQQRYARTYPRTGVLLIAEKVETYQEFQRAADLGYSYFQGYFFSRPEMLRHHDIPGYKLNYLRVLQAVNQPEINLRDVSDRIKSEASMSYRLLRYLNSPAFPLVTEVHSIPHALSLLGERGIRKWVSLVAIACMGDEKPAELVALPLMRARFCELLAPHVDMREAANDLFLLGLLSAMEAILDMKLEEILKEIAVHQEIHDALLGTKNKLRAVYDLVLHYETGTWEQFEADAALLHVSEEIIPGLFMESVDWARGVLAGHDLSPIPAR
jgi:EAL and modified HD-GYP domain-containing signal transduction protein